MVAGGGEMKLTKRMKQVLAEPMLETSKVATAQKMQDLGIIRITERWIIRRGVPGQSAAGIKPGTMIVAFEVVK